MTDSDKSINTVDARKDVAQALPLHGEHLYRLITENMNDAIWLLDMNLKFQYVSPSMARARGYTQEELMTMPINKHMGQASLEQVRQAIREELDPEKALKQRGQQTRTFELEIIRKDGSTYFSEVRITILRNSDGSPMGFLGVGRDISDRRRIESALLDSEERYRRIANTLTDYLYTVTFENGKPAKTVHGPGCFMVTGYTDEDFQKDSNLWIQMVHPDDRQNVRDFIHQIMTKPLAVPIEHRIIRKDRVERWVRNTPVFHFDATGTMLSYDGIVQDITERKTMDTEMQKAQHLESLSVLASGIAHDFNNLLGGIFGYIDIAREYSASPKKSRVFLEKALTSLDRAKDLSQRLLMFSKGAAPVKKVVDVEGLIRETAALSLAGKNVKAKLSVADNLYSCECDPAQIGRVLNNLIVNAHQSMPDGGTVYITAENADACGPRPEAETAPGPYVRISVRDTGSGISTDKLQKIFDPFFTTKKTGTGLGLTISRSIIRKHGGAMDVSSEESKGTEFRVFLPASTHKAELGAEKKPPRAVTGAAGTDHGRILLMDDEDFVLDIASRMLLKMGFSPQTSQHGEEACDLYRKAIDEERPFCAVILDLTIPAGMGGVRTMKRLMEMDPGVKAIASSGYSDDPVLAEPGKYGFSGVLKKPYMAGELRDALHAVLKKTRQDGDKGKSVAVDKKAKRTGKKA